MANRTFLFAAGWVFPFVLAGLFFWKGTVYDPAVFEPPAMEGGGSGLPVPAAIGGWALDGGETLPADRMYERINGRASYYLQYGATALHYGTWSADGKMWDMYLYEFSSPAGARGAFDGEAPSQRRELEGAKGYAVPGQVAAAAGAFYLSLSAYEAGADAAAAEELAVELALVLGGGEIQDETEEELTPSMLAGEAAVAESDEFLPQNAFGFSSLQEVRTVRAALDGTETVWFRAAGGTEALANYAAELAEYGGSELFEADGGTGGSMFGSWEFAADADGALWGIRDAASKDILLKHWSAMKTALEEK